MVPRYPLCIVYVAILALGLRSVSARTPTRLVVARSPPRDDKYNSAAIARGRISGVGEQPTAFQLGRQRKIFPGKIWRVYRGAWALKTVAKQVRDLRGGAVPSDDSDENFDSLSEENEDDLELVDEEDFGEASFAKRLKQDWVKTPIITRTFFQVSIGIAVCCAVFNQNQWPSFLLLDWRPTLLKLQLWRLLTPFLFLGPLGVNFVLTTHFSWTYMSQLEKLHYREPHTFVMLLVFGMSSLVLLTLLTGGDVNASYTLGHSLSCFMVTVWSRKFAGTKVNVLDMFELPTELLPYFFVAQTLMMEGVIPWVDLSGLLIGYAWQTFSLKGLLRAPKPLVNLFRNNAYLRAEYTRAGKEYGQEIPLDDDEDVVPSSQTLEGGEEGDEDNGASVGGKGEEGSAGTGENVVFRAARRAFGGRGTVAERAGSEARSQFPRKEEEDEEEEEEEEEGEDEEQEEEEEEEVEDEELWNSDSVETHGGSEAAGGGETESLSGEDDNLEGFGEIDEEMENVLDEFEDVLNGDDDLEEDYLDQEFED